jgi:hypothetical protein
LRTSTVSWLAFAALAFAPALAIAEDPAPDAAPAASPADASKKARAAFPEPSDAAAFAIETDFMMNGAKVGEASFAAKADATDSGKVWRCTQSLAVGSQKLKSSATLQRDLRLDHEERNETAQGQTKTTMVIRAEKGFSVGFTEGEKETVKSEVAAPAEATSDEIYAFLLFLRLVPAGAAKYEVETFDSDKRQVVKHATEVKGAGRLKDDTLGLDAEAWVAVDEHGGKTIEVYLDPKDRGFLAARSLDQKWWLVKRGLAKPKDAGPVPDYKKDATSAKEAGIRFFMSVLVGDLETIGAAIHWPSMVAAVKEQMGMDLEEEALKELVLMQVKPSLQEMQPEQAWPLAKAAADGAKETPGEDGAVSVSMGQLNYTAKAFDGKWMITGMMPPK